MLGVVHGEPLPIDMPPDAAANHSKVFPTALVAVRLIEVVPHP